ncbi:MAG: hypothetical protein O7E52_20735 [Candidatus Poribacteria bacterium]|nr:hypothetical protein [Candidatus Poribacteria bacterium]
MAAQAGPLPPDVHQTLDALGSGTVLTIADLRLYLTWEHVHDILTW